MIEETISQLGSLYVAPRARKINIRSSSSDTSCILALTSTFSGGLSLLARSTSISVPIANSEVTFVLLANPYNHGDNTVREIFANTPALPDGTMVYKYDPATDGYFTNVFNNGTWDNSGLVINPGEGFFFSFNSQAARTRGDDLIVTFSGDLPAS